MLILITGADITATKRPPLGVLCSESVPTVALLPQRGSEQTSLMSLENGGKMVAQHIEIAEIFAGHYVRISRDSHMKSKLKKYIRWKKQDNQPYNESFTERELKMAIKQQKNIASGEDTIHLKMIKNYHQKH